MAQNGDAMFENGGNALAICRSIPATSVDDHEQSVDDHEQSVGDHE